MFALPAKSLLVIEPSGSVRITLGMVLIKSILVLSREGCRKV
jgi:hypothetical protein